MTTRQSTTPQKKRAWLATDVMTRGFVFLSWMSSAGFENRGLLKNLKLLRLIEIL
jgi:hypothetical protein